MIEFPKDFSFYTTQDPVSHIDKNGKLVTTYEEGVHLNVEQISSIGIANLSDVASHTINHILGSTSHVVRFHDGGSAEFAYSHGGELLQFSGRNIAFKITQDAQLMLIRKNATSF